MAKSGSLVMSTRLHNKRQKLREERKRVLKICVSKLQNIHDPESYLCKSVLINNTLRNIQLEHREYQKRTRLHRHNTKEDNELDAEAKRPCLEIGGSEGRIGDDVIVEDIGHGHPLCNSYDDVSSCHGDPVDSVILSDTDRSHLKEEEDSLGENLNNNNNNSLSSKVTTHSCSDTVQLYSCTVQPSQSLVQNNVISLESF